ncbi:RraA family protein [Paraburkholderia tropica]|uniref:Putative 4-hydroxy-4-methyl-2-oxoglutarate aldolase n=1 Tax=Paraburkholderia tropica TaxID=92647 RepID=A0AAQ1GIG5_9BURK|nr:RraA family protein [Paraburkholderia tropica]RQN38053.1 RraA family protein [Paraburkholderia tropica]SEJ98821.1 3-hexulose-6-phosphate synthase / 6-phospho-3-hexuloisomerase [Paraburkholderia tropica]
MSIIINPRPELNTDLIARFVAMADVMSLSCVVSDALERNGTMRHDIKPRAAAHKIIGSALTVQLTAGDIVDCLEIFTVARPGDVVVIDAFGETETSIWGGLMTGLAKNAGIVGAVIDGSCRDTDEARFLDFAISSKAVGPRQAHTALSGRREPLKVNVPVSCGGVIVHPGDLVVADEIGVAVVPVAQMAEVHERAATIARNEAQMRELILEGKTFQDLLAKFGRI